MQIITGLGQPRCVMVCDHGSPKLKISLLIRNTIISDKTNIREFEWEIVF